MKTVHALFLLGSLALVLPSCNGVGAAPPRVQPEERPDDVLDEETLIVSIEGGKRLDLAKCLPDDETIPTVVMFTAKWCPACRRLDPQVEQLIRKRSTVALRKVDIVSWDSPVAEQHGIRQIPTLWLFHGKKLVDKDTSRIIRTLQR